MAKKKTGKSSDGVVVFSDVAGRTLIGEVVEETADRFKVKNPAIIHVQGNGSGQWQVSIFPLIFNEFITNDKEEGTEWDFPASTIVKTNVQVVDQLKSQYTNVFNPSPIVTPPGAGQVVGANAEPKVVKLFDE